MATFNFKLENRPKADGTHPIKLYLNINQKHFRSNIGISVPITNWDAENELVYGMRRADVYNQIITTMRNQVRELLEELELIDYTDAAAECKRILSIVTKGKKKKRETFYGTFKMVASDERLKPRTQEIYKATIIKLERFCEYQGVDVDTMRFEDITRSWIGQFDKWLALKTPSRNGRNIHLRNIRHVCNYAIQEHLTTFYDWRGYSIKSTPTVHRALSVSELRAFLSAKIERDKRQYLDMFKLTFCLIGINAADLFLAKKDDARNGRLEYTRAKTNRYYSIKIEPEAQAILNKYKGKGEYLLNVMDRYKDYRDYLHRLNENLQLVGDCEVGRHGKKTRTPMFPAITTYWARHTWASIAAQLDIPNETIAASLGHGYGNRITAIYIDFDRKKVDEANRKVLDFVFSGK